MKKEYCKPILDVISYESNKNITALDPVSLFNGNDATNAEGESFNDIIWQ